MKKNISVFMVLFFSFFCVHQVWASAVSAREAFLKFENQISTRYDENIQEEILDRVQNRLLDMSYEWSLSSTTQQKILEIQKLLHENRFERWYDQQFAQTEQKNREKMIRETFQSELQRKELSESFKDILSPQREFLAVNSQGEFIQEDVIYKLSYSNYFPVNAENRKALQAKSCRIIEMETGDVRCIENYTFLKKKPYSELSKEFAWLFTSDYKISEKKGYYVWYLFEKYRFYEDVYGVYDTQIETSGFDRSKTFLYIDAQGRYNFVTDYTQRQLLPVSLLYGISQKQNMLRYILADAKHIPSDITKNMQAVSELARNIPKGKTREETLENIYAWILENISYTQIVDLKNTQMFSAWEALKVWNGVCTAYARLMSYLLLYHNFYDVETIEGYVIDAPDFPQIGHAWVRMGERYFDPTFDDPIGIQVTRTPDQYRYFDLPKDIFYANRFHYEDLPESFKNANKAQISQYIFNILSNLQSKYESETSDYLVFAPVIFRKNYALSANTLITPELLASKLGSYPVAKNTFTYQKNGKDILISWLKYYTLTSENTQAILDTLNYDIADMTLFDWELVDGTREWRLAYELTTR